MIRRKAGDGVSEGNRVIGLQAFSLHVGDKCQNRCAVRMLLSFGLLDKPRIGRAYQRAD